MKSRYKPVCGYFNWELLIPNVRPIAIRVNQLSNEGMDIDEELHSILYLGVIDINYPYSKCLADLARNIVCCKIRMGKGSVLPRG